MRVRKVPQQSKRPSDFRVMVAAYRRNRANGLGMADAVSAATDEVVAFRKGIPVVAAPVIAAAVAKAAPAAKPRDMLGLTQAILVNSVAVVGVYGMRWTVGTAVALYWCENILNSLVVIASLRLWCHVHQSEPPGYSMNELVIISLVGNGAQALFILPFLLVIVPHVAPAERFDRHSCMLGVIVIAILIVLGFTFTLLRMRTIDAAEMSNGVTHSILRVIVMHLTLVIGIWTVAIFGGARVFFAVFAAFKFIAEMSWRVPARTT